MPRKAVSHSQRQAVTTKGVADKAYDANQRQHGSLKTAKDLRSSARWQRVRVLKLGKNPLCEDPNQLHRDRTILAREVDHIVPLQEAPDKAFAWDNLQSLCTHCHAMKSAEERKERG